MNHEDFTTQYAIRQPDGKLWGPRKSDIFGNRMETDPEVFDTVEQAMHVLKQLQAGAAGMGIEFIGTIESRLCTPFSVTDPSEQMVSELTAWLQSGGMP